MIELLQEPTLEFSKKGLIKQLRSRLNIVVVILTVLILERNRVDPVTIPQEVLKAYLRHIH